MTASRLLNGKALAEVRQQALRTRVNALQERGMTPTLGVIVATKDEATHQYVRNKKRVAEQIGIHTDIVSLKDSASESDLSVLIQKWNTGSSVHGVIVQKPVAIDVDIRSLEALVSPLKDVDCLHPENLGLLASGAPRFLPPTAKGILSLFEAHGIQLEGKNTVLVGRSASVGTPLALTLMRNTPDANATVTICHRATADLSSYTRRADILIVAAGSPHLLSVDDIRKGAVVVDVGIHRRGSKWIGDVNPDGLSEIASAYTPVPGGVGPMTVISLLENVVSAFEMQS